MELKTFKHVESSISNLRQADLNEKYKSHLFVQLPAVDASNSISQGLRLDENRRGNIEYFAIINCFH